MKSAAISADSKIAAVSNVELRDLGRAAVLVRPAEEEHFGLSRMGRQIWQLLPEARTAREIVAQLQREYDVNEAQCSADVIEFLQALAEGGLIHVEP